MKEIPQVVSTGYGPVTVKTPAITINVDIRDTLNNGSFRAHNAAAQTHTEVLNGRLFPVQCVAEAPDILEVLDNKTSNLILSKIIQ